MIRALLIIAVLSLTALIFGACSNTGHGMAQDAKETKHFITGEEPRHDAYHTDSRDF